MSILEKWGKALDSRNEDSLNDCIHDDYKFTLHSAGKNLMEKLGMETQYVIKDRGHGQAPDFYEIVESWLK